MNNTGSQTTNNATTTATTTTTTSSSSSSATMSTSLFDSALASVSEMASKSQDFADFAKQKVVQSSKDSLSRAFSLKRTNPTSSSAAKEATVVVVADNERKQNRNRSCPNNGQQETESSSASSFSPTIVGSALDTRTNSNPVNTSSSSQEEGGSGSGSGGGGVQTSLNDALNRLESASTSLVSSAQKHKQNLFAKIESHSLSISSALFGGGVNTTSSVSSSGGGSGGGSFSREQQLNEDPFEEEDQEEDNMMTTNATTTAADSAAHSSHGGSIKRKSKPIGSIEYVVEDKDTIEKIALKCNTVPSELHRLNRLVTRVIFPGQVLFVPDPNYVAPVGSTMSPPTSPPSKATLPMSIINEINTLETSSTSMPHHLVDSPVSNETTTATSGASGNNTSIGSLFKWKQTTPQTRPGHVEKQQQSPPPPPLKQKSASQSETTDPSDNATHQQRRRTKSSLQSRHTLTEEEARKLDQECMQRFLKINCKIVTRTKGSFDGVLIITPSALMFDPFPAAVTKEKQSQSPESSTTIKEKRESDVSDPSGDGGGSDSTNGHKYPNLSYSTSIYDEASALIPIEIISNVIMYEDLHLKDVQEYFDYQDNIDCSSTRFVWQMQIRKAYGMVFGHVVSDARRSKSNDGEKRTSGSGGDVSFDLHAEHAFDSNDDTHHHQHYHQHHQNQLEISEETNRLSPKQHKPHHHHHHHHKHHHHHHQHHQHQQHSGSSDTVAVNTSDETTETATTAAAAAAATTATTTTTTTTTTPTSGLGELSINDSDELSLSTSSSSSSTISCYLCIKVNKNKDYISCPLNRKMKNRLTSEFWFQIYDNSYRITDKICAFFLEWKSDPTFAYDSETMPRGQFQLVKQDEKLNDLISDALAASGSSTLKSSASTNRLINRKLNTFVKDWEIVNLKEYEQKLKKEIEIEKEYKQLPNLKGQSTILKEDHLRKLNVNLIPRAVGYNWVLSFSTELNGFSLNTMYRLVADVDSPCLVVVMDTSLNVFGAMSPCKLVQSEHYYGTGESFLFTFYPSFRVFKWTGENNFFIRGNAESFGFGCAEGYHGLWFDGDLLNGHTQRSKTYDNDMLTSSEYFTIAAIEVWTFAD